MYTKYKNIKIRKKLFSVENCDSFHDPERNLYEIVPFQKRQTILDMIEHQAIDFMVVKNRPLVTIHSEPPL